MKKWHEIIVLTENQEIISKFLNGLVKDLKKKAKDAGVTGTAYVYVINKRFSWDATRINSPDSFAPTIKKYLDDLGNLLESVKVKKAEIIINFLKSDISWEVKNLEY